MTLNFCLCLSGESPSLRRQAMELTLLDFAVVGVQHLRGCRPRVPVEQTELLTDGKYVALYFRLGVSSFLHNNRNQFLHNKHTLLKSRVLDVQLLCATV